MTAWRLVALVPLGLETGADPWSSISAAAEAAGTVGAAVEAMVIGRTIDAGAERRAHDAGAHRINLCTHAGLAETPSMEPMLAVAEAALRSIGIAAGIPSLLLLPAGPDGEELAARLAVRFDGTAFGRCTSIAVDAGKAMAVRAAFGGRAQVTLSCEHGPCFATMRARPQAPRTDASSPATRIELAHDLPEARAVERHVPSGGPRPLEGAKLVVCGGRGIGGEEGFAQLGELATLLGGVVAGSLPAVDAGWTTVSQQVGQSGRYVTPEIYIAVGVSGTPQHLAGIGPDTRILAINSDASAEIFRHAEAGLVADWREALPALIERLRASP